MATLHFSALSDAMPAVPTYRLSVVMAHCQISESGTITVIIQVV